MDFNGQIPTFLPTIGCRQQLQLPTVISHFLNKQPLQMCNLPFEERHVFRKLLL